MVGLCRLELQTLTVGLSIHMFLWLRRYHLAPWSPFGVQTRHCSPKPLIRTWTPRAANISRSTSYIWEDGSHWRRVRLRSSPRHCEMQRTNFRISYTEGVRIAPAV